MAALKRPNRKKVVIGGIAVLAVLSITTGALIASDANDPTQAPGYIPPSPLTVTVPGDLDGDNKVTAAEKKEKETAKAVTVELTNELLPKAAAKDVMSMIVTPSGQKWWDFVSSMGPARAYRAYDGVAPKNVNWYAVTWARAVKPYGNGGTTTSTYAAIHVAFPDAFQALDWAGVVVGEGFGLVSQRDNVVTIVPLDVDPFTEPFPQKLKDIKDVKQTTGYWAIDYSRKIAFESADSPHPAAYKAFWTELGFGDATWEAASRDPGRWVGTLNGWDQDKVDLEDAIRPLVMSGVKGELKGDGSDSGEMSPATDQVFVAEESTQEKLYDPTSGDITAGNRILAPVDPLPDAFDFLMVIGDGFTGAMTATGAMYYDAPLRNTVHWIIDDTMTVEFRDATEMADPPMPSPTPNVVPEDELAEDLLPPKDNGLQSDPQKHPGKRIR